MNNLWPDFNDLPQLRTPTEILSEQSQLLNNFTNGYVNAILKESEPIFGIKNHEFEFEFILKGTHLKNYKFKLFKISHDISIYPVELSINNEILEELKDMNSTLIITNEDEFLNKLQLIFNSDKVKSVIGSIISLSR